MIEKLTKKKEELLKQKAQTEANLHAVIGALQVIEQMIKEEEEVKEDERPV